MNPSPTKIIIVSLFFLLPPIVWLIFTNNSFIRHHDRKPFILCTTSMIADTVKQIGGDKIDAHGLMGPGIDPHLYKAREGDVHRLAQADIIFYNGLHLEGKMANVLQQMKSYTKSIAIGDALSREELLSAGIDDLYDPHIWHDVTLWMKIVAHITTIMCEQKPENSNFYKKNSENFCEQLKELDIYIRKTLEAIPPEQRILITAHDAFSYFGKAYNVQVVGLQGISTDADISTRDIHDLVDYLIDHRMHAIFIESSIPARSIQAVYDAAAARNWSIIIGEELFSDALGDVQSGAHSYITMIKHNVDAISKALSKSQTTN